VTVSIILMKAVSLLLAKTTGETQSRASKQPVSKNNFFM
jgi:hypothetical protein